MMLIAQLSKKTGVSIPMIRYYEKLGLLNSVKKTQEDSKQYAYFDEETAEKLELIEECHAIGLSFEQISELLDVWYNERISHEERINILQKQHNTLDQKIRKLEDARNRVGIFISELQTFS